MSHTGRRQITWCLSIFGGATRFWIPIFTQSSDTVMGPLDEIAVPQVPSLHITPRVVDCQSLFCCVAVALLFAVDAVKAIASLQGLSRPVIFVTSEDDTVRAVWPLMFCWDSFTAWIHLIQTSYRRSKRFGRQQKTCRGPFCGISTCAASRCRILMPSFL